MLDTWLWGRIGNDLIHNEPGNRQFFLISSAAACASKAKCFRRIASVDCANRASHASDVLWRVDSKMAQGGPEIDKPKTVRTQAYHCRPPRRGHANQFCGVGGPDKMRCPALLTGMKQQHVTLGGRVSPCDKGS